MGNLVDVGHSSHLNSGAVVDLRELLDASPFLQQRTNPTHGCRPRGVWRARCSAGLFFHLVLPHSAPAAGDWRWRLDLYQNAARFAGSLGSLFLFWWASLLLSLTLGTSSTSSR